VKQRGRKSEASLATVTAIPLRLIPAPADLSPEEAEAWGRIVATKPSEWWDAATTPMLAQLCRASVQAELIGDLVRRTGEAMLADADELPRYKELRKIQAALSGEMATLETKLRLTPQSRYRADKADTTARRGGTGNKPWHHDVIEAG